ncbi:MAG TPA: FAD-dependent oxidoreductase [Steroidobacteraceae bacterium]
MTSHVAVLVVGAGIHGAGIAQAAAAAGYEVLLLEKSAIAAGSSSRSSKLIHGGLRYLETGQFRLVRESLAERATLLRIAPQLVQLRRFYLPVYRHTRRRPWQLRIGLSLYALLAGFRQGAGFGTLPRSRWHELDGLETHGLETVLWYHDAQTDDARLTRAVVHSAQSLGAELAMPATFLHAQLLADGALVRFALGGAQHECHASVLVNAAGPWAGLVAAQVEPRIPVPKIELVQGSHIMLDGELRAGIYYLESPRDGRAIFVMPWHAGILVGTTEMRFRGSPDQVEPSIGEQHYLLQVLRRYFPRYRHATLGDVRASFAGLRVLPGGTGHAFHRTRETLLVTDRASRPRVLSVYGGKYTTWRATAAHVLERIRTSLPQRTARALTDELPLPPE